MKAKVFVTLKRQVLDPQGKAVKQSLASLGYSEVEDVRIGKMFEVQLNETDKERAATRLAEMSKKLLSNPIIEDFKVEITEG